jgi:hypothetical protein
MISGRTLITKSPSKDLRIYGCKIKPAPRSSRTLGTTIREKLLPNLSWSWILFTGGAKLHGVTFLEGLRLFKLGFRI